MQRQKPFCRIDKKLKKIAAEWARLETRTKESGAWASTLVVNQDAQRKRLPPQAYRIFGGPDGGARAASRSARHEPTRRDPKGGELCLGRVKPGETLVEARSDTNVQIVRQTWA